ncbi:probable cytochrome P450 9h1 [Oppia nitens]|uniref:probable cytochrome P450 9h1 n=1 Tax=Oppia nitens TaxID=1686743 RepID=UPI0023DB2BDB|nr:probable cytochrome P450 9h1 [Oppia nitens]
MDLKYPDEMIRVGSFFNQNIKRWKQVRNKSMILLTTSRMRRMYDQVIVRCSANLVKHFAENIGYNGGQQFAVKAEMARFNFDIFLGTAFSLDSHMGNQSDPGQYRQYWSMMSAGVRLEAEIIWREMNVRMPWYCQSVANWWTGSDLVKSLADVKDLISRYLVQRLENRETIGDKYSTNKSDDIVDVYLKSIDQNVSLSDPISIEMMSYYLVVQFLGLFGSINDTLSELVVHLAGYPEVQKKIYKEIAEALDDYENSEQLVDDNNPNTGCLDSSLGRLHKLSYDTLIHLPYMDAAIKEFFRTNSFVRLSRVFVGGGGGNTSDTEAGKCIPGIQLRPNDRIDVQISAIHMSDELFDQPAVYNPDRFLDPANQAKWSQLDANSLLNFGLGPQMCVGSRLAMLVIKSLLAHMIYNYELCLPQSGDPYRPKRPELPDIPNRFYHLKCCIKSRK